MVAPFEKGEERGQVSISGVNAADLHGGLGCRALPAGGELGKKSQALYLFLKRGF